MNVVYCSVIIFYLLSIAVVLCTVLVVQPSFYSVTVKFSHTFYKCKSAAYVEFGSSL